MQKRVHGKLRKKINFYEDNLTSNSEESFVKEYQEAKAKPFDNVTESIIKKLRKLVKDGGLLIQSK